MKMALRKMRLILIFIYGVTNFVGSSAMNIDQNAAPNTQSYTPIPKRTSIHMHFYPKSVANLMLDFFKSYKHIKRLTLFMCNDNKMHSTSFSIFEHGKSVAHPMQINESHFQQNHDSQQNRFSNFQQIVKYLMDSENFFIKGVRNDVKAFNSTSGNYSTTGTNPYNNDDDYDEDDDNRKFMYVNSIRNMLKCGDFKQGVVLDLRCHQSKYILQQVNNSF